MTLTLANAPIPVDDRIALGKRPQYGRLPDPQEGKAATPWVDWFTRLFTAVGQAPSRLNAVSLDAQSASIAATDFAGGVLGAGLYRLTYYTRVTRAGGVSSSLAVTFAWTDGGVAQSAVGAATVGNTTQTWLSDTILIRADAAAPVTFATTYASAGAPTMQYSIHVVLEQVRA